jgi:hypothetical protein
LPKHVLQRLGLAPKSPESDLEFVQTLFDWLADSQTPWDQFYHDWFCADAARAAASPEAARYDASFDIIRAGILDRGPVRGERLAHPYFQRPRPASLVIDEVEALWAPIAAADDWSLYEAKLVAITAMREALSISCHQSVADAP